MRPARCAIFFRGSTTKPKQEHGLAAQLRACKEFLERRGLPTEGVRVLSPAR